MATINQIQVNGKVYDIAVDSANVAGEVESAAKVGENTIGSAVQPIYLDAGVPTPGTYTLEKSVPSDAVFTDTTYSAANETNFGLVKLSDSFEAAEGEASQGIGASAKAVADCYSTLNNRLGNYSIVVLTQAEYDALTPDASTLYFIKG